MPTPFHPIPIHKSIRVDSVRSVLRYEHYITREPYDENYPFWQINFLISGNGYYEVDGERYELNDGDVLFRRPGKTSRISRESGTRVSLAIISFSSDSHTLNELPKGPVSLYGEERATLLDLIRTGARVCSQQLVEGRFEGYRLKEGVPQIVLEFVGVSLERFLVMVLCRLKGHPFLTDEFEKSNRHNSNSALANEIQSTLVNNLSEALRLDDLAKQFGISTSGLMKVYKREFGVPIMRDFIQMKMEQAKRMISHGNMNFTEIAERLGYTSVGYFSRVFRSYEGINPTEYSRRMVSKRH